MLAPLLFTTNRGFICLDEKLPAAYLIDSGRGTYYGITYSDRHIFVAARRVEYALGKNKIAVQDGIILVFDYALNQVDELHAPFLLRDLHQLYYFNNALWAVCTYDCMIAIHRDGNWEKWYPLGADAESDLKKAHHLNSIYCSDGIIYIGGSIQRVGLIYSYRVEDRELLEKRYIGYSSHNIWRADGAIYTLSSMASTCVNTMGNDEIISRGNFIRGAVATTDARYFGISESVSRASREGSSCMIKKMPAQGPCSITGIRAYGQINEIRSPGRQDLAHPSVTGKCIDTTDFADRFSQVPLVDGPCMREMPGWYWRLRGLYQNFDIKRRKRNLRARKFI